MRRNIEAAVEREEDCGNKSAEPEPVIASFGCGKCATQKEQRSPNNKQHCDQPNLRRKPEPVAFRVVRTGIASRGDPERREERLEITKPDAKPRRGADELQSISED